jgi:hypothetical protein
MEEAGEDEDEDDEEVLLNVQTRLWDDWKAVMNRANAGLFDNMVQAFFYCITEVVCSL